MKITGQQLRKIASRENECFQSLVRAVMDADSVPRNVAGYRAALSEINDLVAEIRVYRQLIAENTKHSSSLAVKTIAELLSDE